MLHISLPKARSGTTGHLLAPDRLALDSTGPRAPARSLPAAGAFRRRQRPRLQAVRQNEGEGVGDSIDTEFAQIAGRQRALADSAHLELAWQVAKV